MREKFIPTYAKDNSKMNRRKAITPIILIVLLLCVLAAGTLAAKYIYERNSDGVVIAKYFYFTSDFLDGETHTLTPGSKSVSFTVGNHADQLRYSEVDIHYEVTVTLASGTKATDVKIENGKGTLTNDGVKDDTVTISGLKPGTYTVTAVGEGGYKKTLKATIVVPESGRQLYYNIDNSASDYVLLTVWNEGDESGKVKITYAGIPDNTNPNMETWKTGDDTAVDKTVEIEPHQSKVFRFFGETEITVADAEKKDIN